MAKKKDRVERTCVLTREVLPISRLLRFVLAPDNSVVVDLKCNLPGRGVWIKGTREAVEEVIKRRLFARGFKEQVYADKGLADQVEILLEQAALGAFSISRKAGNLTTGFAKVEAALRGEAVLALVHATDASEDGVRKLAAVAASRFGKEDPLDVIRLFNSAQMNMALGRDNVIHAALLAGQAGRNFRNAAGRLTSYRTGS
ncbi:RNA-binding protein [Flexibacterium corallicola]|uniref:RNA-binding protein n=1 Tax=Flexibacterium corallicola TaxID=3037259 RepID=UPI00286EC73F|nr:RNA-binding protein [Pseudovibrio sp. M1P-2-3]